MKWESMKENEKIKYEKLSKKVESEKYELKQNIWKEKLGWNELKWESMKENGKIKLGGTK